MFPFYRSCQKLIHPRASQVVKIQLPYCFYRFMIPRAPRIKTRNIAFIGSQLSINTAVIA
ncbi:hypothetical protein N7532_004894 [Penicillium argentinense]|uniref:Uncharacterized protein n=1 Tax=Penicillium argentinense TaxID=1131581 RepID=A0A9W9FCU9_9EURO|nr:uncharacterized protein N7532_004894 [Penicillium argentinense]KAJ5097893.1 hypothetical protein N7532_004894 [Penicillium argentinense]